MFIRSIAFSGLVLFAVAQFSIAQTANPAPAAAASGAAQPTAPVVVTNEAELVAAIASAGPGTNIQLEDREWGDLVVAFTGQGKAGAPIVLSGQTPGGARLRGSSRISIDGEYLVVRDLYFDQVILLDTVQEPAVSFRSSPGEAASHCRLTNCVFANLTLVLAKDDDARAWVALYGQDNRVDHCTFRAHNHRGPTLTVERARGVPDRHVIAWNHFLDRDSGTGNGWESIRVGESSTADDDSFTIIRRNLIENIASPDEREAISIKASSNLVRGNTLRNCEQTITLRHGNNTVVDGNIFVGDSRSESGAIRIIGAGHTITNNVAIAVDDRAGGAISLNAGISGGPANGFQPVLNVLIAYNTILGTAGAAMNLADEFGSVFMHDGTSYDRDVLPDAVTVAHNLFVSNDEELFVGNLAPMNQWAWGGNLAYDIVSGSNAPTGTTVPPNAFLPLPGNPMFLLDAPGGLWRPEATSPVIDPAQVPPSVSVAVDVDSQPRDDGLPDIGADEGKLLRNTPPVLFPVDVGANWFLTTPRPDVSTSPHYATVQAEHFHARSDVNWNLEGWEVILDPDALGGFALRSPNDLSLGTAPATLSGHKALVSYRYDFEADQAYYPYFRVRRDAGTTDDRSFWVGTDFGGNPTEQYGTDEANYVWVKGATALHYSQGTGSSPDLILGLRESLLILDAIVLHEDADFPLTDLDALFQ